jgi:hypothetical protein
MNRVRLSSMILMVGVVLGCHRGGSPAPPGPDTPTRGEAALAAALRWIPTNAEYRGLPVVLMAGSAHGDFRLAWIDSLKSAALIHHACTTLTVVECPDSVRAAYVGFNQPVLATDRSADVSMTVFVLNPAACGHDSTQSSETSGRLHMPWPGSTVSNYSWTQERSATARC